MSTMQRTLAPRVGTFLGHDTLAHDLARIGETVPEQQDARHVMEANRLGFLRKVTPERLRRAWFRRLISSEWTLFDYEHFCTKGHALYGGKVPLDVQDMAERIHDAMPNVERRIYAMRGDPVFVLARGDEEVIMRIWVRYANDSVTYFV